MLHTFYLKLGHIKSETIVPVPIFLTHIVTTSTGGLDQVLAYYPFGSPRIQRQYGSLNQKNRYVGQDYDEETQLNYLQQRYQNAGNGQFISQDPVFLDMGLLTEETWMVMINPQAMNSYSYAGNNPIHNKDPQGETFLEWASGKQTSAEYYAELGEGANYAYEQNRL